MQGYAFQMEIIVRARKMGFSIAEVRCRLTLSLRAQPQPQAAWHEDQLQMMPLYAGKGCIEKRSCFVSNSAQWNPLWPVW